MKTSMRTALRLGIAGTALAMGASTLAATDATIPAVWKVQEISYSYVGFTTAYDCDAAEDKVKRILTALGAHPSTKVRASGCDFNRPSKHFFVTITSATPIPASEAKKEPGEKSRQELLKRLGAKSEVGTEEFPAVWKSVSLTDERKLDIRPGDCELMEGIRDHVLPKLGAKIEHDGVRCTPNQLSLAPPELKVSVLAKAPGADEKSADKR